MHRILLFIAIESFCFMKIEPQTFTEKVKCVYNLVNEAFKYLCTLKFNNILPY